MPSATAVAVVALTQLALANGSEPYRRLWMRGRYMILASRYVARRGAVCGIGVVDHDWFVTGGYAAFHRAVPLYWATPEDGPLDPDSAAFDTVVYDRGKPLGAGYVEQACFGDSCVAQRQGSCSPQPMTNMSGPPRSLDFWRPEIGR